MLWQIYLERIWIRREKTAITEVRAQEKQEAECSSEKVMKSRVMYAAGLM